MCYSLLIIKEVYTQHIHVKAVIQGVMLAATREVGAVIVAVL